MNTQNPTPEPNNENCITKVFDIHDFITPEFLAHHFNVESNLMILTFFYVTTTKHKVVISKKVESYGWRISCFYNGVEESKTVLTTIGDLITALFLFGVPTLAFRIKNYCLTTK